MSSESNRKQVFQPGIVVLSPAVMRLCMDGKLDPIHYFKRHIHGDWGDVPLSYGVMNELALERRKRLFSGFKVDTRLVLWAVTRLDNSATTLLLPDEYEFFKDELND